MRLFWQNYTIAFYFLGEVHTIQRQYNKKGARKYVYKTAI